MTRPEEVLDVKEWFTCNVPRKDLKILLKRDNYHAAFYFGLWFLLLGATGYLAFYTWPTLWAIPAFLLYGVVYSSGNARWHEASHGTAFKTSWVNDVFYFFCGAMELRDTVDFRWSHARHHSYTLMRGVDAEIPADRPPNLFFVVLDFFYLYNGTFALINLFLHSVGIPSKKVRAYVPKEEYRSLFWSARAVLALHGAVIVLSILTRSILPLLFFTLPRFYGGILQWSFILSQHAGMHENVWDHRLCTRSVRCNFVFSFLFMNMENHVEHHMYPLVPFHALPALSRRIKAEMVSEYPSLVGALLIEIFPALLRQWKEPGFSVARTLPGTGEGENKDGG